MAAAPAPVQVADFFVYEPFTKFEKCMICLADDLNSEKLQNGGQVVAHKAGEVWHAFHKACITEWLRGKMECPACRGRATLSKELQQEVGRIQAARIVHAAVRPALEGGNDLGREIEGLLRAEAPAPLRLNSLELGIISARYGLKKILPLLLGSKIFREYGILKTGLYHNDHILNKITWNLNAIGLLVAAGFPIDGSLREHKFWLFACLCSSLLIRHLWVDICSAIPTQYLNKYWPPVIPVLLAALTLYQRSLHTAHEEAFVHANIVGQDEQRISKAAKLGILVASVYSLFNMFTGNSTTLGKQSSTALVTAVASGCAGVILRRFF